MRGGTHDYSTLILLRHRLYPVTIPECGGRFWHASARPLSSSPIYISDASRFSEQVRAQYVLAENLTLDKIFFSEAPDRVDLAIRCSDSEKL
ncbi:hypothetical protein AAHA92_15213 [Salvia divinorum]|uniref:Uncharacterized protein n=1 Tax=Salvia divinorum TaxID=28513 RepID=A0ABD1HE20_SALDI